MFIWPIFSKNCKKEKVTQFNSTAVLFHPHPLHRCDYMKWHKEDGVLFKRISISREPSLKPTLWTINYSYKKAYLQIVAHL